MENGSWGPLAAKKMRAMLETMKNVTILEPVVTLRSALNETSRAQMEELANALTKKE